MRHIITTLCCAAALVACAKSETPADTAAAATPPPPPAPAPLKLSDVAGKWNVTGKNEAGDSTLVTFVLTATGDSTGWSIKFPDRAQPVPMRVVLVDADSVVTEAGPFPSVLRKGVSARTTGAFRLQNGMMVGTTTARYNLKTADSVRRIVMMGMKAP